MNSLVSQVSDILQQGLSKGLISTSEVDDALDTLHSFLQKYPTYVPKPARVHNTNKAVWSEDEVEMWERVQPILDKAQGSTL